VKQGTPLLYSHSSSLPFFFLTLSIIELVNNPKENDHSSSILSSFPEPPRSLIFIQNRKSAIKVFGGSDFSAHLIHGGFRDVSAPKLLQAFDKTITSKFSNKLGRVIADVVKHGPGILLEYKTIHCFIFLFFSWWKRWRKNL
jgi:hypothetical protein